MSQFSNISLSSPFDDTVFLHEMHTPVFDMLDHNLAALGVPESPQPPSFLIDEGPVTVPALSQIERELLAVLISTITHF